MTETSRLLSEAAQASAAGKFDQAAAMADEAALVWPATPSLRNAHRPVSQRWQILKVGMVGPVNPVTSFPFATEATRRRDGLTRLPFFEASRIDGGARYRSRFLESWEPTDLGRQAVFTLRSNRSSRARAYRTASKPSRLGSPMCALRCSQVSTRLNILKSRTRKTVSIASNRPL